MTSNFKVLWGTDSEQLYIRHCIPDPMKPLRIPDSTNSKEAFKKLLNNLTGQQRAFNEERKENSTEPRSAKSQICLYPRNHILSIHSLNSKHTSKSVEDVRWLTYTLKNLKSQVRHDGYKLSSTEFSITLRNIQLQNIKANNKQRTAQRKCCKYTQDL